MDYSAELGKAPIGKLIWKQALPASVGFMVMSIYMVVDTIFVGQFVNALAIAAISVVMPITFLISSIGMSIGIGGSSIISRKMGENDFSTAENVFGNMVAMTLVLATVVVIAGLLLQEPILILFGAKGDILPWASDYFNIILLGIPFLAWAMMSNNVMRSEGQPNMAMLVILIPAVVNILLDYIFILKLNMGIKGAAWATSISYIGSAGFGLGYFLSNKGKLNINPIYFKLNRTYVREITLLGTITLIRQGSISLLTIVLNHSLFVYGGEMAISTYGIINRLQMFCYFPVMGINQALLPIVAYNYGAKKYDRVIEALKKTCISGTLISLVIYVFLFLFSEEIVGMFTKEKTLLEGTPLALVLVFSGSFLMTTQLIGASYYQSIGKATPALLLTLLKQFFSLIPLVLLFPLAFGIEGIWYAFPAADVLTTSITLFFIYHAIKSLNKLKNKSILG